MSVKIMTDIPAAEAAAIKQICLNAGAMDVQEINESNGSVTIIATYPDSAALKAGLAAPS